MKRKKIYRKKTRTIQSLILVAGIFLALGVVAVGVVVQNQFSPEFVRVQSGDSAVWQLIWSDEKYTYVGLMTGFQQGADPTTFSPKTGSLATYMNDGSQLIKIQQPLQRYSFSYDASGILNGIVDGYGNTYQLESGITTTTFVDPRIYLLESPKEGSTEPIEFYSVIDRMDYTADLIQSGGYQGEFEEPVDLVQVFTSATLQGAQDLQVEGIPSRTYFESQKDRDIPPLYFQEATLYQRTDNVDGSSVAIRTTYAIRTRLTETVIYTYNIARYLTSINEKIIDESGAVISSTVTSYTYKGADPKPSEIHTVSNGFVRDIGIVYDTGSPVYDWSLPIDYIDMNTGTSIAYKPTPSEFIFSDSSFADITELSIFGGY